MACPLGHRWWRYERRLREILEVIAAPGARARRYQMQLLTWNTQPGDSLFFHFSGAPPAPPPPSDSPPPRQSLQLHPPRVCPAADRGFEWVPGSSIFDQIQGNSQSQVWT